MCFWSTETIKKKQTQHSLIAPFEPKRTKSGAYELSLAPRFLITPGGSADALPSPAVAAVKIPPGQFALLYTEEYVKIPKNVIAFISLKGRVKFKGLINISGFQVDPGFTGHLKFSVYNASGDDVHLNVHEPCFAIWFADLDDDTDPYDGIYKDQTGFTTEDRDRMSEPRHSTETLHDRLQHLEDKVGSIIAVGVVVLLPLLIGLVVAIFDHWFAEKVDRLGTGKLIIIVALLVGSSFLILNVLLNDWLRRCFKQLLQRKTRR